MSFGEMTITLDDLACLLHLPVRGKFYTPISVTQEEAVALAVEIYLHAIHFLGLVLH
ncbi:serine/threonine-protein phosphatase 7 long form-like protein, partial [Trifolium medium]|nr:serine/threonine-protein phosphatase 7 long form-like protein [Trifolium medium]